MHFCYDSESALLKVLIQAGCMLTRPSLMMPCCRGWCSYRTNYFLLLHIILCKPQSLLHSGLLSTAEPDGLVCNLHWCLESG